MLFRTLRFLTTLVACVFALNAAEKEQYFVIEGASPGLVLHAYEDLSGKKIVATEEVNKSRRLVTVGYTGTKMEEFLKRIEEALRIQANIELVPQKNGSILARRIPDKKG